MPNRILKDSICTSPNIDALSREAEVFFYRLLVQCDDYGRMDARPAILRAKCYPLQVDTVPQDDIRRWLAELVQAQLVILYRVDGGDYLQMRTWERHQQIRAKRSKYPDMITSDINCDQVIANVPVIQSNPIQTNPVVVVVDPTPPTVSIPAETNIQTAQAAAVFSCWQDNMRGTLSTVIVDDLNDLINTYGADAVIRAITEAARSEVRTMRYVTGILKNWAAGNQKPAQDERKGRTNGSNRKADSSSNGRFVSEAEAEYQLAEQYR